MLFPHKLYVFTNAKGFKRVGIHVHLPGGALQAAYKPKVIEEGRRLELTYTAPPVYGNVEFLLKANYQYGDVYNKRSGRYLALCKEVLEMSGIGKATEGRSLMYKMFVNLPFCCQEIIILPPAVRSSVFQVVSQVTNHQNCKLWVKLDWMIIELIEVNGILAEENKDNKSFQIVDANLPPSLPLGGLPPLVYAPAAGRMLD